MRVALVSAHYPPNFVSGGTLVPQRIAHELARRGHEIRVFAGRLDDAEAPLSTFTETDDEGVPVTWINTTPWTAWNDPKNVDNPDVQARFAAWLDEHRPDIVHFHSLQTLGASLVSAAQEAGCRTVVTMHDFWWLCARQFLADVDYRPCCVVVAAGTCACQAGRDHLDARAAILAPHLAAADLVLAPSAVAADVLRANGVAPGRLAVNENGMPGAVEVRPRTSPATEGPIRFRYTGGNDAMKGAAYLSAAVERVASRDGWELTVHAPPGDPGGLAPLAADPRVHFAPPYPPRELDRILAETDVLLLPSMARETHSIMTREALLRGVPVIATDALGPEQVVRHMANGLIVSSLDPESLAGAMDRLVEDRHLLGRLTGAGDVTAWTVDDQLTELESLLRALGDTDDPVPDWSPSSVVFVVGIDGAPLRYRAQFPAEALGLAGVEATVLHYNDPRVEAAVRAAGAVVVYRVPATPRILRIIDEARAAGTPVAFDVDDLIVDPEVESDVPALRSLPADEAALWRQGVMRYRTTLEHCDAYIGSTEPLVERVAQATGKPTHLKQNAYGLEVARRSDDALRGPRHPGPVRIGYFSGTKTHDEDLRAVVPAIVDVLDAVPDAELWLGGLLPDVAELARFGDRIRRLPLRPWNELPAVLRQVDVNLAPLADLGTFNQSKSAIKWLEAALVATPTVATATRPFVDAIDDGIDGVLVHDPAEWAPALERLVTDGAERARMGAAARRSALLGWSPHVQGERMIAILRAVRDDPATRRTSMSAWTDVTVDEPAAPQPVPLTPYPADDDVAIPSSAVVAPADGFVHKLWWSLRNETPSTIARRVVRRLRP